MRSRLCFVTISLSFAPDRGAWALSAFGLHMGVSKTKTSKTQTLDPKNSDPLVAIFKLNIMYNWFLGAVKYSQTIG